MSAFANNMKISVWELVSDLAVRPKPNWTQTKTKFLQCAQCSHCKCCLY